MVNSCICGIFPVSLIVSVVVLVVLPVCEPARSVYACVYSGPSSSRSRRIVLVEEVLDKTEVVMIAKASAAHKQLQVCVGVTRPVESEGSSATRVDYTNDIWYYVPS